jgi:hypothetical protein
MASPEVLELDRQVVGLVREMHETELRLAGMLSRLAELDGFRRLGFSSAAHYGDQRGIGPVMRTKQLLRLGGAVERLPETRQAYLDGRLGLEQVDAMAQVARSDDQGFWIETARRLSTHDFQRAVREERVRRGEVPPVRRLLIDFRREDEDALRAAHAQFMCDMGRSVGRGEAIGEFSRSYLERHDRRRLAALLANGQDAIDPSQLPEGLPGARYVPAAVVRAVWERDRGRCRVPGCGNAVYLHMGHIVERWRGGLPSFENLLLLCATHNFLNECALLLIEGDAIAPTFRHPDGRPFGEPAPRAPP